MIEILGNGIGMLQLCFPLDLISESWFSSPLLLLWFSQTLFCCKRAVAVLSDTTGPLITLVHLCFAFLSLAGMRLGLTSCWPIIGFSITGSLFYTEAKLYLLINNTLRKKKKTISLSQPCLTLGGYLMSDLIGAGARWSSVTRGRPLHPLFLRLCDFNLGHPLCAQF